MTDNETKVAEYPKAKRKYTKKSPDVIPVSAPQPSSAATLALESQVLELVNQRISVNAEIANATVTSNEANARLQGAQQRMKQLEYEVNYRLALIQQMKGGPATTIPTNVYAESPNQQFESGYGVSIPAGVGSIPPQPAPVYAIEGGRRVRSESAESVRAAF